MPVPVTCTIPDIDDLPFIEVSLNAGVPVVTGTIRHFQGSGAMVLSPGEFLEQYRDRSTQE